MSEHDIQSAYFEWVRIMQKLDFRYNGIIAIPNQAKRTDIGRIHMWEEGARAGVHDVMIIKQVASIEFKDVGKKASPKQNEWSKILKLLGCPCLLTDSSEHAEKFTRDYFGENS